MGKVWLYGGPAIQSDSHHGGSVEDESSGRREISGGGRNRELRQIARDRQDVMQIELRLKLPDQLLIARAVEDQPNGFQTRAERGKGNIPLTNIGSG